MKIREAQTFSDEVVDMLTKKRISKKYSRYQIAQNCNITETALCYIEKHERRPKLYTLKMIADCLDVKLSEIIQQIENKED